MCILALRGHLNTDAQEMNRSGNDKGTLYTHSVKASMNRRVEHSWYLQYEMISKHM